MTVIGLHDELIDENDSAVKLARYAHLIGLDENQFFGVNNPDTASAQACSAVWTHHERATLAKYLREAQDEIEQITNYPLFPRYFLDEQHYYGFPIHADWVKIINVGFPHTETIHAGMPLVYATDPVAFFHATTVTDEDEIRIYHPGTDIEIIPSYLEITGGNVLVEVPWARLVKPTKQNNPATGWTYTDVPPSASSPYETTVDIARVYNDDSIEGGLFWPHRSTASCTCNCSTCCGTCGDYSVTACIYIRNAETGALDVLDATYSAGAWTHSCSTCYCDDPTFVRVNYKAGLETLTYQAEDAIVRLAHSKMPSPPCGCGMVQEMWTRDRAIPDVITTERAACPFGLSDGSWIAWKFANAMRFQEGLALG